MNHSVMKTVITTVTAASMLLANCALKAFQPDTRPAAAREQPNVLALTHATVIDGTGAPAQPDITVIVTGERITALARSATLHPPTNAVVVDATGKYLIPGLWDMHVHWYDKEYLPLFLANGVTGVRIMLGLPMHQEWRKEIAAGKLTGPRMLVGSTLVDGPKPLWPGSLTAANAAEGRQAVVQAKQSGADFIKVYSLLPREAYFAIAEEAKKQGIPFAGHVPVTVSVAEASAAGHRSIEHLTGMLEACARREPELMQDMQGVFAGILATNDIMSTLYAFSRREAPLVLETYSSSKAKKLFAELKRNQTWQCPTLVVLRNMGRIHDGATTNDVRVKYVPRELRVSWNPSLDIRFKDTTATDFAIAHRAYRQELKLVGAMARAGVGILAGTDCGNPYCFPGFSLHDELALLVEAGLTPMEALQAATRNGARFMGREHELGTIEPGKLADLVLLTVNPLKDIRNTRRIEAVVYGGKLLPRPELDAMLCASEALASKSKISIVLILGQTIETQGIEGPFAGIRS
jgi:imidazolonepropionase-like amidohydrolase